LPFSEEFDKLANKRFRKAGGVNEFRSVSGRWAVFEPRLCELDPFFSREIV